MEPTIEKLLQNIPFAGMGTTLERNGLIGVIRELIKANKYTVDYILNYCESVGYQRNMAEQVFEELTGLSPKLIINNNEYYNAPIYVPACTIAWGIAKTKPNVAFYVVPGSYGYSVMEKNETEAPIEVIQMATIPEAIDELKKVAKKIQTLDKIITSKLLETEDVATIANDIDQTSKPYAVVDPIFELKKNFKNKVINANGFEREARKLVAEEKITVDEAEDLMSWKQDLIDEDESYANEVLQHNEEWKPLDADDIDENAPDYENRVKEATTQLSGMIDELEIFKDYAKRSGKDKLFDAYIQLGREVADEWDIKPESLFGEMILENAELVKRIENLDIDNLNKEVEMWKKQSSEDDDLDSFDYLYSLLVNGNITEYKNGVKKLYQQGPSKLMDYMDWLEENNINPKEALKVMKNASLKKVESNFTSEQEEKFKHLWELHEQGNISEYETELKNMEGSDIVKFINWMGFYGKGASLKKATNIPIGNVPTEKITLVDGRTFTVRYNPKEKGITTIFNEDGKEIGVDAATRLQLLRKLFHKGEPTIVNENPKTASKKVISENVSVKDLEQRAKHYEDLLKEEGYTDMKVSPNFAYGSYGFYFDWTRDDGRPGQKYTGLGTKKETWKNLELAYYELVNKIDWFMKRKTSSLKKKSNYKGFTYSLDKNNNLVIYTPDNRVVSTISDCGDKSEKELENLFYETLDNSSFNKKSSKKVTAENMTLEDMEDEDNKTEVEKEVEKIEETPIDELLQDTTPLDYFDEEIKEDKVDTINDVVSKCITEFSDKFKDFDKYDIKILSYKTKILDPYTTSSDEMIPDNEVNADAVLQVILAINNKADNAEVKKLLAVFSITDGKMHWTGTVRDENDKIVAFTDQGLDSIFNDEEVEDVEEVI